MLGRPYDCIIDVVVVIEVNAVITLLELIELIALVEVCVIEGCSWYVRVWSICLI